jgi:hypothetical protein
MLNLDQSVFVVNAEVPNLEAKLNLKFTELVECDQRTTGDDVSMARTGRLEAYIWTG